MYADKNPWALKNNFYFNQKSKVTVCSAVLVFLSLYYVTVVLYNYLLSHSDLRELHLHIFKKNLISCRRKFVFFINKCKTSYIRYFGMHRALFIVPVFILYFHNTSMKVYNFTIDFFVVSSNDFEIQPQLSEFIARWHF